MWDMQKKTKYKNGIYYTPQRVSDELINNFCELNQIESGDVLNILDPACGEGALLNALMKKIGTNHIYEGCDLFRPKIKISDCRFNKVDFFNYDVHTKFDAIITNPPFIQFGRINETRRNDLFNLFVEGFPVNRRCDLWVYFLLKSTLHLKSNGSIAAILPWSFLEADYAKELRDWLLDKFESIQILLLNDKHFEGTEKRILLLWLNKYRKKTTSLKIGFSNNINEEHSFQEIETTKFNQSGLICEIGFDTNKIIEQAIEKGFKPLKDFADVKIGIVTGANNYFIKSEVKAKNLGFVSDNELIYTSTKELEGLFTKSEPKKVMLNFSKMNNKIKKYISKGIKSEYHKRRHCELRVERNKKWYDIDLGEIPDAFVMYRTSKYPYLSLNPKKYYCTNSIHKIIFSKKITLNQKKWIALSFLSSVSQLSLEHYSRHYGNGMIKLEPSSIKQSIVFVSEKKIDIKIYNKVSRLLLNNKREEASIIATNYIREQANLSKSLVKNSTQTLKDIHKRRK
jgi:adenine-specific DNA-methyltransferase